MNNGKLPEGVEIVPTLSTFIEFSTPSGQKSYFDYVDGNWQFWGDASVDESAQALFDAFAKYVENYIKENKEKFRPLLGE